MAFEARIKRTTVLDNQLSFAFGLGEPGFAVDNALVDDTSLLVAAGKDFVGFQTVAASNEEIDAIYQIGGGGVTVVSVADNVDTSVADTWMKFGGVFDPNAPTDQKMKYFIDGVEIDYDTAVTDVVIADGTAFPTDEELTLVLLTQNGDVGGSVVHPLYMDWWAVGSYCVDT